MMLLIEIIEQIIDILSHDDDTHTLKACALVSPGWLPRARFHMFVGFKLDLKSTIEPSKLEDTITSLQRSSLPFSIIQRMDLTGGDVTTGLLTLPCWYQLRNVTELYLQDFDMLDTELPPFLGRLSQLRYLNISDASFLSPFSVVRMIDNIPQLLELKLTCIKWKSEHRTDDWDSEGISQRNYVSHHSPLRFIILNQLADLNGFIDILLGSQLDLTPWSLWTHNLDSDSRLMNRFCASLRTLDLRLHHIDNFDLTAYESLHTLVMSQVSAYGPRPLLFFDAIVSESFRNLVLCLDYGRGQDLIQKNRNTFNWEYIDQDMTDFHPSASVLIVPTRLGAAALGSLGFDLEKIIAELLPQCASRGMLRVYPCDAQIWKDLHVHLG